MELHGRAACRVDVQSAGLCGVPQGSGVQGSELDCDESIPKEFWAFINGAARRNRGVSPKPPKSGNHFMGIATSQALR